MTAPSRRTRVSATLFASALLILVLGSLPSASSIETEPSEPLGPGSLACSHAEPIPIGDLDPVSTGNAVLEECPGIRPGARLSTGCTMNFLFQDENDYYMGTAGHCTGHIGQRMRAPGVGEFGSVVYRINQGIGWDFALIRVDTDKHDLLQPDLCAWAGPNDADPLTHAGQPVHMYGWGVATNDESITRARSGVLLTSSSMSIDFVGFASGGDSGSPTVNALGSALAINTHVLLTASGSPVVYGTHIDQALRLSHNNGFDVEVVSGQSVV